MLDLIAKTTDYLVPAMRIFDGYGCGPMGGYWGGAGFGFFGVVITILFWIGILAIAALIISKIFRGNRAAMASGSGNTPLDILNIFARLVVLTNNLDNFLHIKVGLQTPQNLIGHLCPP